MYGNSNPKFNLSSGWLNPFKMKHEIKSSRKFGENGSIAMENIKATLPSIKTKLDQLQ